MTDTAAECGDWFPPAGYEATLTADEEAAMDAATNAILERLTLRGLVVKLSLVRVTAALASQTAGYFSATQTPFTEEQGEHLTTLKVAHFEAGVGTVAENMKTIGSA